MTIKLTDLELSSITREAAKRGVSPEEVIDHWLIEGENAAAVPFESAEITEHDFTERRELRKWHESLAPGAFGVNCECASENSETEGRNRC
jgi:hypothetical protein